VIDDGLQVSQLSRLECRDRLQGFDRQALRVLNPAEVSLIRVGRRSDGPLGERDLLTTRRDLCRGGADFRGDFVHDAKLGEAGLLDPRRRFTAGRFFAQAQIAGLPEQRGVQVVAAVDVGDEVRLTFPFFSDEPTVTATVTRMSDRLDQNSRTMLVEVVLDNPTGKWLPGMFGEATIKLSTKDNVAIPSLSTTSPKSLMMRHCNTTSFASTENAAFIVRCCVNPVKTRSPSSIAFAKAWPMKSPR